MTRPQCRTCQDTGTVLGDGPAWCDEYGGIHSEPVLEPCPDCSAEHAEESEPVLELSDINEVSK